MDVFGEVFFLSCVYIGRIVIFCVSNFVKEKDSVDFLVCIWENELFGGMKWVLEDDFKFDCKFVFDSL